MKIPKELKIGVYFLVMLIALVWGVNFLKGRDIFGKVNNLYAVFDEVEGLQTTSQVMIKGMKVGTVNRIKLDQKSEKFIVELSVKSGYKIPDNSTAVLFSNDIMGNKAIKITMGDSDGFLKDKDFIKTTVEPDMISALTDDLPKIKDSLMVTVSEMNHIFAQINKLLNDTTIDNIATGMKHLSRTLNNFERLSITLNRNSDKIISTLSNLDSFSANLKDNSDNISKMIANFTDFSDSLKNIRLSDAVDEVNALLARLNSGQGTAGKFIYDDSLYLNLSGSLEKLDLLLNDIRANPKRYVNISVFGGKNK